MRQDFGCSDSFATFADQLNLFFGGHNVYMITFPRPRSQSGGPFGDLALSTGRRLVPPWASLGRSSGVAGNAVLCRILCDGGDGMNPTELNKGA